MADTVGSTNEAFAQDEEPKKATAGPSVNYGRQQKRSSSKENSSQGNHPRAERKETKDRNGQNKAAKSSSKENVNHSKHDKSSTKETNGLVKSSESRDKSSRSSSSNGVLGRTPSKKEKIESLKVELETIREVHYTKCGKQWTCRNATYFAISYGIILMFRTALIHLMFSISSQLKRRYFFPDIDMDFIMGCEKVGFVVTLLFVGFYGNKMHKPMAVLAGGLVCGTGGIVASLPYFVACPMQQTSNADVQTAVCYSEGVSINNETVLECSDHPGLVTPDNRDPAFSLLCLGQVLMGCGSALFATLGFVYMDESERKDVMPLLIGVVLCLNGLGELLAVFVNWVVGQVPEALQGSFIFVDGWSITAWWTGLLSLSVCLCLLSFLMLMFPRWLKEPKWLLVRRLRHIRHMEKKRALEEELKRKRKEHRRRKRRRARARAKRKAAEEERKKKLAEEGIAEPGSTTPIDIGRQSKHKAKKKSDANGDVATAVPDHVMKEDERVHDTDDSGGNMTEDDLGNVTEDSQAGYATDDDAVKQNGHAVMNGHAKSETKVTIEAATSSTKSLPHVSGIELGAGEAGEQRSGADVSEEQDRREEEEYHQQKLAEQKKKRKKLGRKLRDLPMNLWYLLTQGVFLFPTVGCAAALYLQAGFYPTMPAYLHQQFLYDMEEAINVAGIIFSTAAAVGTLASGLIIWKFQLSVQQQLKLCMLAMGATLLAICVLFPIGCQPIWFKYTPFEWDTVVDRDPLTGCSMQCGCTEAQYYPVCTAQQHMFPSPCHAGCQGLQVGTAKGHVNFTGCQCEPGGQARSKFSVSASWCGEKCSMSIAFGFVAFLVVLAQSMCHVTAIIVFLRVIPEKMRSLSLGFSLWLAYLASYVPGIAVYNAVADQSCAQWLQDRHEKDVCWRYQTHIYRYAVNGLSFGSQAIALIFMFLTFIKIKHVQAKKEREDEEEERTTSQDSKRGGMQNAGFSDIQTVQEAPHADTNL